MPFDWSVDPVGAASPRALTLAFISSSFETGIRSPLDKAILQQARWMSQAIGRSMKSHSTSSAGLEEAGASGCRFLFGVLSVGHACDSRLHAVHRPDQFDLRLPHLLLPVHYFRAGQSLFHTGWFAESLTTQTLVLSAVRLEELSAFDMQVFPDRGGWPEPSIAVSGRDVPSARADPPSTVPSVATVDADPVPELCRRQLELPVRDAGRRDLRDSFYETRLRSPA